MSLGPLEIVVIFVVALLAFGPERMPELARQAGRAMRELRKVQESLKADLHELVGEDSPEHLPPSAEPVQDHEALPPKQGPPSESSS